MDPSELYLPIKDPVIRSLPNSTMNPVWWKYFLDVAQGLSSIDLGTQVTGTLQSQNGGTSVNNGGRTLTIAGFSVTLTQTGPTNVTLPGSGTLLTKDSAVTATHLNVVSGVNPDSGGIKHKRLTTGAIAGGTTALVLVTWTTAFLDASYTVVASVVESTAALASLSVVHVETVLAASVAVRVSNAAGGPLTGQLQVVAFHD